MGDDFICVTRQSLSSVFAAQVNGLERFWRPVAALHWQLESRWNYVATTTFIASGPGGSALAPHFDFDEAKTSFFVLCPRSS